MYRMHMSHTSTGDAVDFAWCDWFWFWWHCFWIEEFHNNCSMVTHTVTHAVAMPWPVLVFSCFSVAVKIFFSHVPFNVDSKMVNLSGWFLYKRTSMLIIWKLKVMLFSLDHGKLTNKQLVFTLSDTWWLLWRYLHLPCWLEVTLILFIVSRMWLWLQSF